MWAYYINKNHPLSYSSLVDAVMLNNDVSYDPIIQHLDINGKVNGKGAYCHFGTGNNISSIHCYQFHKNGQARNDHKVKTCCFWSNRLYNPFTHKLGLEALFEISDDESDTKDDRTTNTNIKESVNYGNGQVAKLDVKTVDLSGGDALQGFLSQSEDEEVTSKFFDVSALP